MTAELYRLWTEPIRQSKYGVKILIICNKIFTRACYILYFALLIFLAVKQDMQIVKCVLVPGISFLVLSVFRAKYNAPRPYEVLDIDPIIKKDTKGKSFPSRHVFSVFVIAMAWLWIMVPAGIVLLIVGICLACTRVLGGVHFPKDVIAGAVIGILCGIIGFWIFP